MTDRPVIVTLCGSTRFYEKFRQVNFHETYHNRMVFSIGCDFKSDEGLELTEADKVRLDRLHLHKIAASDEILVINHMGYIGDSTRKEIAYAYSLGKRIRYMEFHTKNCMEYTYQSWQEIAAYAKQWPRYCRKCNGQGQFEDRYDPSPAGVSLGSGFYTDYEPCDSCTGKLLCARCGEEGLNGEGEGPCSYCGWNYGDYAPGIYECCCYEVEMMLWEKAMLSGVEAPRLPDTDDEYSKFIYEQNIEKVIL